MTDRVYPSSKPNGTTTTTTNGGATTIHPRSFPPTKAQLHNPNRHPYRPQPTTTTTTHRTPRRRCTFCKCCFLTILIIFLIILLAATAAAITYLLYHPHLPTFSISSLKITQFNLTTSPTDDSTHLTSNLNITLSSKNPNNKKIIFFFDHISIITQINHVQIANGSFQSFTSNPNSITIIHSTLYSTMQVLDGDSATVLREDLKKKTKLPLKIVMDTQVRVKMESHKSKKVGIRITCGGVKSGIPKSKSSPPSVATIFDPKCKVDARIKIWKWTF